MENGELEPGRSQVERRRGTGLVEPDEMPLCRQINKKLLRRIEKGRREARSNKAGPGRGRNGGVVVESWLTGTGPKISNSSFFRPAFCWVQVHL